MKKSSLFVMMFGTTVMLLFSLGMCMALISQWQVMPLGIFLGCLGMALLLITWLIYRKMEYKKTIRISLKQIGAACIGICGTLTFGAGMCFSMLWEELVAGILLGVIGIFVLLGMIVFLVGIKKEA